MLLLTGASGQLGTELSALLPDALCPSSQLVDITCTQSVERYIAQNDIHLIINCAAYTAVDAAEENTDKAFAVNAKGPENLAKSGVPIIHISTDYVFDGTASQPYTEDDTPTPQSIYGHSKLMGEHAILEYASAAAIIRTSWVHSPHGKNFVTTMRNLGKEKDTLNVICDQVGTPTYAHDLASTIIQLIPHIKKGEKDIYHYSNEGVCSWYDFAYHIMKYEKMTCNISPITSNEYPTKALRPHYSVLNKSKIKEKLGITIPHWTEGLEKCLKQFS